MYANLHYFFEVGYELVRFFLFCILMFNPFKYYVFPFFYDQFQKLKEHFKELEEKGFLLERTHFSLQKKVKEQEKLLNSLEHKVSMWNQAVVQDTTLKNQELKKVVIHLSEKKKIQQKKFHDIKVQGEVLPQAIEHAFAVFKKQYVGNEGEVLLEKLINRLDSITPH